MTSKKLSYFSSSLAVSLLVATSVGYSAGMGLWEWGVPGVGTVSAGSAASAMSAASETANPAQASLFNHAQLSVGAAIIPASIRFSGVSDFAGYESKANNIHFKKTNAIPDMHYIQPLHHGTTFTFGVTVPNGLGSQWDASDWNKPDDVYNISTLSSVKVIDVNPGLSYQVSPKLAVALGVNALEGEAIYDSELSFGGASTLTNKLKGSAFDWNAGVLFMPTSSTRVGLSYRSGYTLRAKGPSVYTPPSENGMGDAPMQSTASADLKLPSKLLFSIDQAISARTHLLASVFHTHWSVLQTLTIKNTPVPMFPTQQIDLHYKDTNLYSLGASYQLNPKVKLSAGFDKMCRIGYCLVLKVVWDRF